MREIKLSSKCPICYLICGIVFKASNKFYLVLEHNVGEDEKTSCFDFQKKILVLFDANREVSVYEMENTFIEKAINL